MARITFIAQGRLKDRNKMERRLGKIQARHPQVNDQPLSPMKALTLLSSLQSADIVLPTTDGREIRLRRITSLPLNRNGCFTNSASAFRCG